MRQLSPGSIVVGVAALLAFSAPAICSAPAAPALKVDKTITIPGGAGGFDWMRVDANSNRVFATHKGTKSLAIVDLTTDKPIESPKVGTAQGIAIDRRDNKIFLGDEDEHSVIVLDYKTLAKTGEISVPGPVDDVLFCAKNGMVYADMDNGESVWVIDAKTEKVVSTIKVPTAPEKIEYDRTGDRIYQAIKSNATVQVIDPATNKVEKSIDTAPATGPHGLVIDSQAQKVYCAGSNGKLVAIDVKSGKVTASVGITAGVDQIAFDRGTKRIYCACKGAISVVEVKDDALTLIDTVTVPKGCHTITVDNKTHAVWTCYADEKESYLLKLMP